VDGGRKLYGRSARDVPSLFAIIDTGGGASSTLAPFGGRRLRSALLVHTNAHALPFALLPFPLLFQSM
jgi:hypothetical protein